MQLNTRREYKIVELANEIRAKTYDGKTPSNEIMRLRGKLNHIIYLTEEEYDAVP